MSKRILLLTCEHGGARVPPAYVPLFQSSAARTALESHRGSDHGALGLARSLQQSLGAPLVASTVTRLLVDLNRSVGHPQLFSELSRGLGREERAKLLASHYFPHRDRIESWIEAQVRRGHCVLHIGVHSFTSRTDGTVRRADVGLLYDPSRFGERSFCSDWKAALESVDSSLRVRRNYPFLGKADGLVTHLRAAFGPRRYLGIELEANQALLATPTGRRRAARSISMSLGRTLASSPGRHSDRRR
ncbi:MAG: N-formylglutamate amidohydrolase [Polyangiales bacterium]